MVYSLTFEQAEVWIQRAREELRNEKRVAAQALGEVIVEILRGLGLAK